MSNRWKVESWGHRRWQVIEYLEDGDEYGGWITAEYHGWFPSHAEAMTYADKQARKGHNGA